jgi:hypothetical protein
VLGQLLDAEERGIADASAARVALEGAERAAGDRAARLEAAHGARAARLCASVRAAALRAVRHMMQRAAALAFHAWCACVGHKAHVRHMALRAALVPRRAAPRARSPLFGISLSHMCEKRLMC